MELVPKTICLFILFASAFPLSAQDAKPDHSPFGCSEGAVEINLHKDPALRFKHLDQRPGDLGYSEGHEFVFTRESPFLFVKIYLTGTLPEAAIGTSSAAQLALYAQTSVNVDDYRSGHNSEWWRLERVPGAEGAWPDESSASLTFEASRIAGCFNASGADACSFADLGLATPDKEVPLITLGFRENLGGANAANWTEARVLLDFRSSPPSVAITADCGYNEGGGVCTAFDSGQMERTNLHCDWKGDAGDFLCSKESKPEAGGHADFYLLSNKVAPLRADEVASLGDALVKFKIAGHAGPLKVRGIGPVSWIDELKLDARRSLIVLASPEAFYFVSGQGGTPASLVTVYSRPFLGEASLPDERQTKTDAKRTGWTLDTVTTFASRPVFRDRRLAVLQAVSKNAGAPFPSGLYWIGIDSSSPALAFDVVELAGEAHYAGCARYDVQATAISIGPLGRTFESALRVQPATVTTESDDSPLAWKGDLDGQEIPNCVRAGKLWWQDRKFHASIDSGACPSSEKPRYVKINGDGTVTLTESDQP